MNNLIIDGVFISFSIFFFSLSFDKRDGWRWSCAGFSYARSWALVSSSVLFYLIFLLLTVAPASHDKRMHDLFSHFPFPLFLLSVLVHFVMSLW